jgi:hypothetical protein
MRDDGHTLLQFRGAGAVHQRSQSHDEDLYGDDGEETEPGSPSKNRPRRNWLGSLKRVFSGGGSGISGAGSPTHDGMVEAETSDFEPRSAGLTPEGRLLNRKQGREAWDSGAAGEESDWDVERAVEQRLVQVMFTVPKEKLRVVNAEVEKDEEAMGFMASEKDELDDPSYIDDEIGRQDDYEDMDAAPAGLSTPRIRELASQAYKTRRDGHTPERQDEDDHEDSRHDADPSRTPSVSVHTAEAVRLGRPRTRVLAIVESLENLSRNNSPTNSPQRLVDRDG